MANILFTWELGAGLGHTTLVRPFAEALVARGHRVLAAVRDIDAARKAFGDAPIPYVPAPFKTGPRKNPIRHPRFYGHILHNNGLADADELCGLLAAWRSLYTLFQPDVILFNHSPTALLAARGWPKGRLAARRILLGDGFCSPPACAPLPIVRPWKQHNMERLARDEQLITSVANRALAESGAPPLERLGDMYADVEDNLLLTFAELDHFGPREKVVYRGALNTCATTLPHWPSGGGPRVFAYLMPSPEVARLLRTIAAAGCKALVHGRWVSDALRAGKQFANVHLSSKPVDIDAAAAECDAAILNATHGATAALLLAGKPILQLPHTVEQVLTARNTRRLGAGLIGNRRQPEQAQPHLQTLLEDRSFTAAAAGFADEHRDFDRPAAIAAIVERIAAHAET